MKKLMLALFTAALTSLYAANQTATLSPVLPETSLPFTLEIETASFSLPTGLQSFASAAYKGKWFFIAGRTNGLHTFDNVGNNFPPNFQNTTIYVVDPDTGRNYSRSLFDHSGLSQEQIDILSVTNSQSFQKESKLYIVGGYGINTTTGEMETKSTLTEVDLKGLLKWVKGGKKPLIHSLRQVSDPLLQVTGGFLFQNSDHDPFLLMLGQNFVGLYRDDSNGIYTQQIRPFWLVEDGKNLAILPHNSATTYPDYRRRDLNIAPVMKKNKPEYVAFGGVFTLDDGVWTVPITIKPDGSSSEQDPNSLTSFKQAMNHYDCPVFGLYSVHSQDMFVVFPGGISFGYFSGGTFQTDSEVPFINQVTTVKIDRQDNFTQYLMNNEYPTIPSTGSNPGNTLLFGAEAIFFPSDDVKLFHNGVIQLDKIKKPTVIGYIAGGIMSTLANTNVGSDSTSSPYVFTVTLTPK